MTLRIKTDFKPLEIKLSRNNIFGDLNPSENYLQLSLEFSSKEPFYKRLWTVFNYILNTVPHNSSFYLSQEHQKEILDSLKSELLNYQGDQINLNLEEEIFLTCDCHSPKHNLIIYFETSLENNGEIGVTFYLDSFSFLSRISRGIKYLFNLESSVSHYHDILLNKKQQEKLRKILESKLEIKN